MCVQPLSLSLIHYPSLCGFSGITVDEISEQQRKEEPCVLQLPTRLSSSRARSFGRQQSSEGRRAVGGIMASGAVIENLIKMLKNLPASSE